MAKHKHMNKEMPTHSHMKEEGTHYQLQSMQKENTDETNASMGYHNMADRANVAKKVQEMQGAKERRQEMGKPGSGSESTGPDF